MAKGGVFLRVEGISDLGYALDELPKATAKSTLVRALNKAAQPIAARARELAPVRTGKLRDSIIVSTRLKNKVGAAEYASVLRAGGTKADAVAALRDARRGADGSFAEVYVGPGIMPHAHLQEFGSSVHGPHPYMRPAWDEKKQTALESIKDYLATEIEKTRMRLARKAAKLLSAAKS